VLRDDRTLFVNIGSATNSCQNPNRQPDRRTPSIGRLA
jgi:hypothetical protein